VTDIVACPGCNRHVDRDETLFCPTCRTDLTPARAPGETPAARAGAGPVAASTSGWRCPTAGCTELVDAALDECPRCYCPRPAGTAAGPGEPAFRLGTAELGEVVRLAGPGPWTVGREQDASPWLSGRMTVSRCHALLRREGGGLVVEDLHSSNGTYVDGRRVDPGACEVAQTGSTIGLGRTVELYVERA